MKIYTITVGPWTEDGEIMGYTTLARTETYRNKIIREQVMIFADRKGLDMPALEGPELIEWLAARDQWGASQIRLWSWDTDQNEGITL
jgi:hypothetical protein